MIAIDLKNWNFNINISIATIDLCLCIGSVLTAFLSIYFATPRWFLSRPFFRRFFDHLVLFVTWSYTRVFFISSVMIYSIGIIPVSFTLSLDPYIDYSKVLDFWKYIPITFDNHLVVCKATKHITLFSYRKIEWRCLVNWSETGSRTFGMSTRAPWDS